MSLRRALDRLPHDRATKSVTREVLDLFRRNADDWMAGEDVRTRITHSSGVDHVLRTLAEYSVLESRDTPPGYRYAEDPLITIEVQRYLRRADHRDQDIQSNVARFRNRYNRS